MSNLMSTTDKKRQNLDSTFKVSPFQARGFGVQPKSLESLPTSRAELWENYQAAKQLNQNSVKSSPIQAKLTVGQSGDKKDSLTAHELTHLVKQTGNIQLQDVEKEKKKSQLTLENSNNLIIQNKSVDNVSYGLNLAPTSGGQTLPNEVREKMENSLDADFSDVSIHTDGQAEQLGALAFAVDSSLHFAQGKYDPASQKGQELIGHELTHVVQQRKGQVHAPVQTEGGNATVVQDPSLEAEADALGAQAAISPEVRTQSVQTTTANAPTSETNPAIQQKSIVQAAGPFVIPPLLSLVGTALSSATAGQAATVAATALGAASQVKAGTSISEGASGCQSVNLDNGWISNVDKQKLNLITQYRLINSYVQEWVSRHPEAMIQTPEPATSTPSPTGAAGAAVSGGKVDEAVLNGVLAKVNLELEQALNKNQKNADEKEFIWSDSGDAKADSIGTVGVIMFTGVRGTFLKETLELKEYAADIPNLAPPMKGSEISITQFRGGLMSQSPQFSTGYGDDLAINLDGGAPTYDQAGNNSHGMHTYSTAWRWDGNMTHLLVVVSIGEDGSPTIQETGRQGTPKDYSGSRLMPWNWLG